jgi:glycosyltransferase involved in cell wall biosynthesis
MWRKDDGYRWLADQPCVAAQSSQTPVASQRRDAIRARWTLNEIGKDSMPRGRPRISVGMPVYNGEPYIHVAIESILNQTFGDFELIISDNASTDQTEAICRDFASRDERVVYSRNQENIGAAANYNRLVDMASAPYFRWSNADDVFAPELHESCASVLDATPDAVLSYGKTRLIDENGNEREDYEDNLDLRDDRPSDRFIQFHSSVGLTNVIYGLMRTAAVRKTAKMGDGSYPTADVNFMGELALYGKFVEIPQCLFYRRMHAAAFSADKGDERQTYFWTAGAAGFSLPSWRKNVASVKAIRRAPIGFDEKRRLALYMLRRVYWDRRELLGDLLVAIRKGTGLTNPGSG